MRSASKRRSTPTSRRRGADVRPRPERRAARDLGRLRRGTSPDDRVAIDAAIRGLALDPRPTGARRLVSASEWRLRVRDFRVIYEINDDNREVYVLAVLRRGEGTYRDV